MPHPLAQVQWVAGEGGPQEEEPSPWETGAPGGAPRSWAAAWTGTPMRPVEEGLQGATA